MEYLILHFFRHLLKLETVISLSVEIVGTIVATVVRFNTFLLLPLASVEEICDEWITKEDYVIYKSFVLYGSYNRFDLCNFIHKFIIQLVYYVVIFLWFIYKLIRIWFDILFIFMGVHSDFGSVFRPNRTEPEKPNLGQN